MYLLAALLILAEVQAISQAQEKKTTKPCAVLTKSQDVPLGSEVQVTCQHSCSGGPSFWTVNNERVADHLSRDINSSHTVLSLKNFSYQTATIMCHSVLTDDVLHGTVIKTYSKPSNVSCLLQPIDIFGDVREMVCHWEHTIRSSTKVTYVVRRTCDLCFRGKIEHCNSATTSCVFKNLPSLIRKFVVVVRANSSTWDVESDPYPFDPLQIWVLAPPALHVTAHDSHLLVELNQANTIGNMIRCRVRYSQSLANSTEVQEVSVEMTTQEKRLRVTIEGVGSCLVYTVSARCAMNRSPSSHWSPGQTVLSRLNPKTFKLNLWRKVLKQNGSDVRDLKIMWTEIPQTCREEYTYDVQYLLSSLWTVWSGDGASVCRPSSCFVSVVPEARVIRLSILRNNLSVASETVYAPAAGETLPRVSRIQASSHDSIITVSWDAPSQNVSGYMVDWTWDGETYFWRRTSHTETTLYDLRDFQLYTITVTPVFDNKTGHGTEAPQVCSRRRVPQAINIAELHPEDTGADVRWDIRADDQCSTDIAYFIVFYRQTDKDQLYNISVNRSRRRAVLEDLEPSTKYRVHVMAKGHAGNVNSSERHFETQKHDSVSLSVMTVCAAVGVLSLCILGMFCVWYKVFLGKRVPNPGHSSLAGWPSRTHQKVTPQFHQPSEGETLSVRVPRCESDGGGDAPATPRCRGGRTERAASTPKRSRLCAAGEDGEAATEEKELRADRAGLSTQDSVDDEDALSQHYLEVLPLSQRSPYRSQNDATSPGDLTRRHVPGNKASSAVYVSLDMFTEGPDRG